MLSRRQFKLRVKGEEKCLGEQYQRPSGLNRYSSHSEAFVHLFVAIRGRSSGDESLLTPH